MQQAYTVHDRDLRRSVAIQNLSEQGKPQTHPHHDTRHHILPQFGARAYSSSGPAIAGSAPPICVASLV